MSAVFGPTFGDEAIAAGLGRLPFSWSSDGDIYGREKLTSAQNATLDGVVAAHDPTKQPPAPPDLAAILAEYDRRITTLEVMSGLKDDPPTLLPA